MVLDLKTFAKREMGTKTLKLAGRVFFTYLADNKSLLCEKADAKKHASVHRFSLGVKVSEHVNLVVL